MATFVPLVGSKRTLLSNSRPVGSVDKTEITSLTIHVRSSGDLRELESQVYDQSILPLDERRYLTHADFETQYGASSADMDLIEKLAQEHDLMIAHRSLSERSIVVVGSLGDLLDAFPADVRMYHHSTGTYRGRRGEIFVPAHLDGIVTGVFGFDTRQHHRSPNRHKVMASLGPGGSQGNAATAFATRYNFPKTFGGTTLTGAGQTIAIIELGGGFRAADLKAFFKEIKSPLPKVTSISVDHLGNKPTNANSDDGEVMLDIEVAGAVAPGANIAVYFSPNNGDKGFIDAISKAVHDTQRNPSVISISWGGPENSSDAQGIGAFHNLFVTAAALGITICVASGDHGVADSDAQHWDHQIHVDHPSVDNLVLSCGGTQIDGTGKDVVWNDGTPFDVNVSGGGGWSGGGGVSELFSVPTYQAGSNVPVSIASGKVGRGVPDIAMSATDYFTRVDGLEGASGGTSAVAPLMSGLIALLNQAKKKNVGFLNPFLYSNASTVMHDVTSGTNGIASTIAGYSAGDGWDACTGLGTPDGVAILNKL